MTEGETSEARVPGGGDLGIMSEFLGKGRPLDAFALAGDLKKNLRHWLIAGPDQANLAIRLLNWLGSPSRAGAANRVARRLYPDSPELFLRYLPVLANTRGPLAAWKEAAEAETTGKPGIAGTHRCQLLCLMAEFSARWQDFDEAFRRVAEAETIQPDHARCGLSRAFVLNRADRREEAVECLRKTVREHPGNVTAPRMLADLLLNLEREDEAMAVLSEASGRLQDFDLILAMANQETERGRYRESLSLADQFERLQPLADLPLKRWIAGWRAFRHYLAGNREEALTWAAQSPKCFIADIADRLKSGEPGRRVELAVPFVKQDRRTCAPATLASIERFWGRQTDHGEIAAEICYDGTPPHLERQWAVKGGYHVREFKVDRDILRQLIDRGVPFTLTTVEPASAHLQGVIGYDSAADTILVREPGWAAQAEYRTAILDDYAFSGPRGMVFLPPEKLALLEGLSLPEAEIYDLLHLVQEALEENDRESAVLKVNEMRQQFPGHRLTWMGERILARWDNHPGAQLAATEALLALYPDQPALAFSRLILLRSTAGRAEQIAFARKLIASGKAPAEAHCLLAEVLDDDARDWPKAELAWDRATRMKPFDGSNLSGYADFLWQQNRRADAVFYYRLASCCDILQESFARSYFNAARWAGSDQLAAALDFLRMRCSIHGDQSGDPALTLAASLESLQRHGEALEVLEDALRRRPNDGALMLQAAESFRNAGKSDRAASLLEAARPLVRPAGWLRQAAEDAVSRACLSEAIACYRGILETEPMASDVHSSLARLLAGTEGVESAIRHLEETCRQHPGSASLHSLLCQWLDEDLERRVGVLEKMLEIDPADDWAMRSLAMDLQKLNRFAEAVARARQALAMAPSNPASHGFLADALLASGQDSGEAENELRRALELDADYTWALGKLVEIHPAPDAQREALRWIISRMEQQVINGHGLACWQQEAWPVLEPDEILSILRQVHAIRPDLAKVWSVLGRHLMAMGRVDEAIALAREAAERFPLLAEAWFDLAVQLGRTGDAEGERQALHQTLIISPQSSSAVRRMATVCETLGDRADARNWLETHSRKYPLDIGALLDLTRLLRSEPDAAADALATARRAVSLAPLDPDAWEMLALCVRDAGDSSEIDSVLAQAADLTREQSHSFVAWQCRATAEAILRGRTAELAVYDEALPHLPDSWDIRDRRALLLVELGRYGEALETCAVELGPPSQSHYRRARHADILYRQGLPDQAIAEMEALAAARPDYAWAARRLLEWHDHRADQEAVLRWSGKLNRLDPHDEVGWGYQADALLHLGRKEEAEACLRKAVALSPGYRWGAIELIKLELGRGDLEAASRTVARVIGRVPAAAIATPFRQMGHPDKALELCRSAVERDSTQWNNHSALSDVLWELGQKEESVDALLQAAFLAPRNPDVRHRLVERSDAAGLTDAIGEKLAAHLAELPGDPDRHSLAADFWLRVENTPAYLGALDAAIAALPDAAVPVTEFADLKAEHLANIRRYREALQVCSVHDTEENPSAVIRRRRAWIEAARGDLDAAIAAMEDALRLDPDSPWGLRHLCDWLEQSERGGEAIPHARRLVALDPDSGVAFGYLASALLCAREKEEAEPHLVRAFRMKPDYEWAANRLFDLQMERNDHAAAAVTVRMMLEHQPGVDSTLKQLVLACAAGDQETAFSAWESLLADEEAGAAILHEADQAIAAVSQWSQSLRQSWDRALARVEPRLPVVAQWIKRSCEKGKPRFIRQMETRHPPLPEEALAEAWNAFLHVSAQRSTGSGLPAHAWRRETRRAIRKNRDLFQRNPQLWAIVAWYLLTIEDFRLGRKWCAGWKERIGQLETWMTVNIACLLDGKWLKKGGLEVRQWALENLPMDHGASFHRATLAMIAAARGDTETAGFHLENIRDQDFDFSNDAASMRFQVKLARLLVALQDTSVGLAERRRSAAAAFREALKDPGNESGGHLRAVFRVLLRLGGFSRLSLLTLLQIPRLWKT